MRISLNLHTKSVTYSELRLNSALQIHNFTSMTMTPYFTKLICLIELGGKRRNLSCNFDLSSPISFLSQIATNTLEGCDRDDNGQTY